MSISQRTFSRPPGEGGLRQPGEGASRSSGEGAASAITDPGLRLVVEALGRLRYGAIQLTVHEGRLVQVDVTERNRFAAS